MPMTLQEIFELYNIQPELLAETGDRILIVNPSSERNADTIHLFSNNPELDPEFLGNFHGGARNRLDFDTFLKTLGTELRQHDERVGRYNATVLSSPVPGQPRGRSVSIGSNSYWLTRGQSHSNEKANGPATENTSAAGEAIVRQYRADLRTFSRFQGRQHELIAVLSRLLARCGRESDARPGIVPHAAGGPLPLGLPEAAMTFLYQMDPRSGFDADAHGVDFHVEPWSAMAGDAARRATFGVIVTAYRDALFEIDAAQFNDYVFDGRTLQEHALEVLEQAGDLAAEFRRARKAYEDVMQFLTNPVTLAMPAQWLLDALYNHPLITGSGPVESGLDLQYRLDMKVQSLINDPPIGSDISPSIRRFSKPQQQALRKQVLDAFERFLDSVFEVDPDVAAGLIEGLPELLAHRAVALRQDPEQLAKLRRVSGRDQGAEVYQAFVQAMRSLLIDLVFPALFPTPTTTLGDVSRRITGTFIAAYLTAVMVNGSGGDAFRELGKRHGDRWSKIVDQIASQPDVVPLVDDLIGDLMTNLTTPETLRKLDKGLQTIINVLPVLEAPQRRTALPSLTGVVAVRRPRELVGSRPGSLELTPPARGRLWEQVESFVEDRIGRLAQPASAGTNGTADEPDVEGSRHTGVIDRVVGQIVPTNLQVKPTPRLLDAWRSSVIGELRTDSGFMVDLVDDVDAFEQALGLIYQVYSERPELRDFAKTVEVLSLANLMRLNSDRLGFSEPWGALYNLTLDMTEQLDADRPDPLDFLARRPLNAYFEDLENNGVTDLRTMFEVQHNKSLRNSTAYCSFLIGMEFLINWLAKHKPRAVLMVYNGTAEQFLEYIERDSLTPDRGRGLFRASNVVATGGACHRSLRPGLILIPDTAFSDGKAAWLKKLATFRPSREGLVAVLPPILLSTGPQGDGRLGWVEEGQQLASSCSAATWPVLVVGPSIAINQANDTFPTTLAASFLVAAYYLTGIAPELKLRNVADFSRGRFVTIGYGSAGFEHHMHRVLWGVQGDKYGLAGDLYLHQIGLALAAAATSGVVPQPNASSFFQNFYLDPEDPSTGASHQGSANLGPALPGRDALRLALMDNPAASGRMRGVSVMPPVCGAEAIETSSRRFVRTDYGWFSRFLGAIPLAD